MQEGEAVLVEALPVLGQAAAAVEPADGALDDPSLGQHDELVQLGSLDDLDVDVPAGSSQPLLEYRPLVAAVGVELQQEREQPEQRAHQQYTAVTVLHVCRMDDGVQQETLGIYEKVALLSLDLLAGIIARRVDREPPFSALLTL